MREGEGHLRLWGCMCVTVCVNVCRGSEVKDLAPTLLLYQHWNLYLQMLIQPQLQPSTDHLYLIPTEMDLCVKALTPLLTSLRFPKENSVTSDWKYESELDKQAGVYKEKLPARIYFWLAE